MNNSYYKYPHKRLVETYKGFDIVFDTHSYLRNYQLFKEGNIQSSLYFISVTACKTAIDTFTRDKEDEVRIYTPITHDQLQKAISRSWFT